MTRTIDFAGKPQEVNVQRKYRAMWIAVGDYRGARIEVKGKTDAQVVAAWQRAAEAFEHERAGSLS